MPVCLPSPRWGEGQDEGVSTVPDLTDLARQLRSKQTSAEALLWSRLRARRLGGWKFKRQVPVGGYVADFLCNDASLIVELDGGHHNRDIEQARDRARTMALGAQGFLVVRFWNHEVHCELDSVCDTILNLAEGAHCDVG
jgi:very-short-patch-repair endonuclease